MIVEGPVVVIGARQAWAIASHCDLNALADRLRSRGERTSADVCASIQELGTRWVAERLAERSAATGSPDAPVPARGDDAVDEVGTTQAAAMTGVPARSITAAAGVELPGRKVAGRWIFRSEDVVVFAAARTTRGA